MSTVAVVIPTLGRASLERALSSVAAQTCQPTEVVVVNNGPDAFNSARVQQLSEICASVSIRVLSLPPFSGPAIARNVGAWNTTADFVAFLDDDDEFRENYLSAMMKAAVDQRGTLFYPTKIWRAANGEVLKQKRLSSLDRSMWFRRMYCHENHGFGGMLVIDRGAFFDLGGFPADLPSGEDRAFAMAAIKSGIAIHHVDEAVVECHQPEGIRAKQRQDKWISNLKIMHTYRHDVTRMVRVVSWYRWCRMAIRGRRRDKS